MRFNINYNYDDKLEIVLILEAIYLLYSNHFYGHGHGHDDSDKL